MLSTHTQGRVGLQPRIAEPRMQPEEVRSTFPKKLQVFSLIEFKPCPKQKKKTRIRMRKQSSDLGGDDLVAVAGFHIDHGPTMGSPQLHPPKTWGPGFCLPSRTFHLASHLGVFLVDGAENWRDQIPGSRHR
ncbi:hypothetical protein H0G86_001469 [Trichoderma simmonsii]|uniref:Uncharacterized protein n=1 Tax=Trichoderma simmonsii TaxID=1491479 RepID=A0A8G0L1M9_9HYPO|nr:hypothetical protein H0G86_001469 [Trichoderma simmonsii]